MINWKKLIKVLFKWDETKVDIADSQVRFSALILIWSFVPCNRCRNSGYKCIYISEAFLHTTSASLFST